MIKKLTSLILILTITFSQSINLCAYCQTQSQPIDYVYDFSDEAQEKFNSQNTYTPVYTQNPNINTNINIDEIVTENDTFSTIDAFTPEPTNNRKQNINAKNRIVIPAGAAFSAVLQSSINSSSLNVNDTIAAVLENDWYYHETLVAPQGSILYGKAVEAKKASGGFGNGEITIIFDELLTPEGKKINLVSNNVTIGIENKRGLKIAATIIISAAMGALIGAAIGNNNSSRNDDNKRTKKGSMIGAGIGTLGGIVSAASKKGENVEVKAGTSLTIRLVEPMQITPYL